MIRGLKKQRDELRKNAEWARHEPKIDEADSEGAFVENSRIAPPKQRLPRDGPLRRALGDRVRSDRARVRSAQAVFDG